MATPETTVVVDAGIGNLRSILRGLERAGAAAVASSDPDALAGAGRIVLPGVGGFGHAMETLSASGLAGVLARKVLVERTPVLGICLGMQLLTAWSEEGERDGLGWIRGRTERLAVEKREPCKVPHLGWNTVERQRDCPLFEGVPDEACFYFAHSYAVRCDDAQDVVGRTEHGALFVSALQREHVFGIQFHPEKSHANGLQVLRNFLSWS
jgi:glutamine amidotransferase